ncbi:uncharacterized protein NPIL_354881 [Nephila pilipes]|uniref:Uncharacterized protein n=1 Tax=Nephila pilipes TaxID=299642 RepID=A0A8X6QF32_NEPPI|nr:uncharacterized protein NPIL_354881 [Nephila pilipes]
MSLKSAYDSCKSTPFSFSVLAVTAAGSISIILALSSSLWLESKPESESESHFVSLGLWRICFRDFQHPSVKFDDVFNGCYYFYGHKSESIPSWLQPGIS